MTRRGETLLHLAAYNGRLAVLKLLLLSPVLRVVNGDVGVRVVEVASALPNNDKNDKNDDDVKNEKKVAGGAADDGDDLAWEDDEDRKDGKEGAGGKARLSVEDGFTGPCVDLLVARNVDGGLPMHR